MSNKGKGDMEIRLKIRGQNQNRVREGNLVFNILNSQ